MVHIIPVVEILAYQYARGVGFSDAYPDRTAYFEACKRSAGTAELSEVVPGSFIYPVSQLQEHHIELFLSDRMSNVSSLANLHENGILAFDGGFALRDEESWISAPGCCSDLEVFAMLQELQLTRAWQSLWNGHDREEVGIRVNGNGRIEFGVEPPGAGATTTYREMTQDEFDAALTKACAQLEELSEKVSKLLPDWVGEDRRSLSRTLCGLQYSSFGR